MSIIPTRCRLDTASNNLTAVKRRAGQSWLSQTDSVMVVSLDKCCFQHGFFHSQCLRGARSTEKPMNAFF
jgi:hypothetical protein